MAEVETISRDLPSYCDVNSTLDLRTFDEEALSPYFWSTKETSIILSFYPITFLFGILGNGLFLLALFQISEMRTVINAYLGNLAVADLIH